MIMDNNGEYIPADEICEGQELSGGHVVIKTDCISLPERVPVYDMTVPKYFNFVLENGLIVHNSGKSFSAKREITNAYLVTNDDVYICDPEAEYYPPRPCPKRSGGKAVPELNGLCKSIGY